MAWHVRAARADELAALPAIEVAAGAVFAAYGLPEVAAEPPTPVSQLRAYEKYGRAWVVVGADDAPVGYLLADVLDGEGHVTQVSVHPRWARRGLGGLLVEEAARWAASKGMTAPSPP